MKILICGDSYCITDPLYPDLHWSEKILNQSPSYEVCNLAYGGCSNALIAAQLLQGLRLNPDFVILSFTNPGRYELDNITDVLPDSLTSQGLAHYLKQRYTTTNYDIDPEKSKIIDQYRTIASSENFEKLKNYFYICFCLTTLKIQNVNFCFSLGGFEYKQDNSAFLKSNFVKDFIVDFKEHELNTNLWYYGSAARPWFHVTDNNVHTLFANECTSLIETKCK
jgi:hypothetical protein